MYPQKLARSDVETILQKTPTSFVTRFFFRAHPQTESTGLLMAHQLYLQSAHDSDKRPVILIAKPSWLCDRILWCERPALCTPADPLTKPCSNSGLSPASLGLILLPSLHPLSSLGFSFLPFPPSQPQTTRPSHTLLPLSRCELSPAECCVGT